jgi:hypothetical protein
MTLLVVTLGLVLMLYRDTVGRESMHGSAGISVVSYRAWIPLSVMGRIGVAVYR